MKLKMHIFVKKLILNSKLFSQNKSTWVDMIVLT